MMPLELLTIAPPRCVADHFGQDCGSGRPQQLEEGRLDLDGRDQWGDRIDAPPAEGATRRGSTGQIGVPPLGEEAFW